MSYPQLTPARPVPGAFFNTPAASRFAGNDNESVRRRLFLDGDGAQGSTTTGSSGALVGGSSFAPATVSSVGTSGGLVSTSQAPQQNLPPVTRAAQAVNQFLQADENYPELDSYCRRTSSPLPPPFPPSMAHLTPKQQAHPPSMTTARSIRRGPPSTRRRCTPSRTRSSATTTPASCRR